MSWALYIPRGLREGSKGPVPCKWCGVSPVVSARTLVEIFQQEFDAAEGYGRTLPPVHQRTPQQTEQVVLRVAALGAQLRGLIARERGFCCVRCMQAAARALPPSVEA